MHASFAIISNILELSAKRNCNKENENRLRDKEKSISQTEQKKNLAEYHDATAFWRRLG